MTEKTVKQGFPAPTTNMYKVDVLSCTYNHAKYIEDCLNGVAMQKADFPFVHHVIDDCSTDGEQDVIKAWIERECDVDNAEYYDNDICTITIAKHKINLSYTIVAYFLKQNMYGNPQKRELIKSWQDVCPYTALCEGDDYWIDSHKLQKQVEYMDEHLDFSMCFHSAIERFQDNRRKDRLFSKICDREYSGLEMFKRWTVATASIVLRKEVYTSQIYQTLCSDSRIIYGDIRLVLSSATFGRVYGFSDCMSVYRRHEQGAIFRKSCLDIWKQQKQLEAFAEHLGVDYLNLSKTKRVYRCVRGLYMAIARKDYKFIHVFCEEAFAINAVKASIAIVSYPVSFVIKRFFSR